MRLEQFGQIIELVNTGSFSQAARNLYISQPSLSHSVKQLEKELGFRLFTRTSDGVIPTQQGQYLIEHFRIIQRQYDGLQQYCQSPTLPHQLSLRVATVNLNRVGPAFSAVVRRHMGDPINFSVLHYTDIDPVINLVTTCQVDFAIVGIFSPYKRSILAKLQNNHIEFYKFSQASDISVVVGTQNPLYNEDGPVLFEQLHPFTLIYYGSNNEDPSYSLPHVTGLSNSVFGQVRVNSSQLFYQTIQTTSAIGLVVSSTKLFEQFNIWKGIRALSIADSNVGYEYGWMKLRRLPLTDIGAELLEEVRNLF